MTAVEFLERQYHFNKQLSARDFKEAKEMESSQATEYAKWSIEIYNLTGRFFTYSEWLKDDPKDQEEPKSHIEYTNTDDCTSMIYNQQAEEQLPTKWFKTEQISTWIGKSITRITAEGESIDESEGGHGKLIVMHQCGDNKEELISQLETMIYGLKAGFEDFAN
jgi:hypothetical protein